ncbi:MAG: hypothetical protein WD207_09790 [Xanthobacteraceae bacterium]
MKRTLIAMMAAAALAASTFVPVPAKADPISALWLIPAVLGGLAIGGAVTHSPTYAAPRGAVYVNPTNCRIVRERISANRYREVEVCR